MNDQDYIQLEHFNVRKIYNNYFGSHNTYLTFKKLLKIYLHTVILYEYEGWHYSEWQLRCKFNIQGEISSSTISSINPLIKSQVFKCSTIKDPIDVKNNSLGDISVHLTLNKEPEKIKYKVVKKMSDFWYGSLFSK